MTDATTERLSAEDERLEWTLRLRKLDAETAQLHALTAKLIAETSRRMDADIAEVDARSAKTQAEAYKVGAETWWYPIVLVTTLLGGMAAVIGALAALVKVLFG